jgi:protein arginine kinase activator
MTFEEFRSSGRLGCPHDYEVFREELRPLLDNIHGSLRHVGKVPRRLPADTRRQTQLIQLRQELQQMIAIEDYERAARIRDQIEALDKQS